MTTQDTGSDERRHDFFIIDNEAIDSYDLSPFTGWLYVIIVRLINQKTGEAFPSLATLAVKSKMSERQVVRCIKELESAELIEVKRRKRRGTKEQAVNHYRLLPVIKREVVTVSQDVVTVSPSINTNTIKTEEIAADKPPRARSEKQRELDGMVDALVDALGLDRETISPRRWSSLRGVGKDFLDMKKPATPEQIAPLVAYVRHRRKSGVTEYSLTSFYADWQRDQNNHVSDTVPAILATTTPQQLALDSMYRTAREGESA